MAFRATDRGGRAILAAWPLFIPSGSRAGIAAGAAAAMAAYRSEYRAVATDPGRRSLSPLYALALSVCDSLVDWHGPMGASTIEELPDAELDSLGATLPGIRFNVGEAVWAAPVTAHLDSLAIDHGTPIDTLHFGLYSRTHDPYDVSLQSYDQLGPPYAACAKFGSGELVRFYREWSRVEAGLPDAYRGKINDELDDARRELSEGNCSCADSGSVELELRRFLEIMPEDPLAPRVRERLEAVRAGRERIRYHGTPG